MKSEELINQVINNLRKEQASNGYLKNSDFGMLKALAWVVGDYEDLFFASGKPLTK